jgi:tRNA(adenine34) deaminase
MLDSKTSATYSNYLETGNLSASTEARFWMALALEEAKKAEQKQEVPVGAILVNEQGEMLARAHNLCITNNDPCAHAEILAIREAAQAEQNYRLPGTVLYVTLEPCLMCLGAMVQARISGLIFATRDPKAGSIVSNLCPAELNWLNHSFWVREGILAEHSSQMLKDFFAGLRKQKER